MAYVTFKPAKKKVIPIRKTVYIENPLIRYVVRWGWIAVSFGAGLITGFILLGGAIG